MTELTTTRIHAAPSPALWPAGEIAARLRQEMDPAAWFLAMAADRVTLGRLGSVAAVLNDRLLALRCFDAKGEIRLERPAPAGGFAVFSLREDGGDPAWYQDQGVLVRQTGTIALAGLARLPERLVCRRYWREDKDDGMLAAGPARLLPPEVKS